MKVNSIKANAKRVISIILTLVLAIGVFPVQDMLRGSQKSAADGTLRLFRLYVDNVAVSDTLSVNYAGIAINCSFEKTYGCYGVFSDKALGDLVIEYGTGENKKVYFWENISLLEGNAEDDITDLRVTTTSVALETKQLSEDCEAKAFYNQSDVELVGIKTKLTESGMEISNLPICYTGSESKKEKNSFRFEIKSGNMFFDGIVEVEANGKTLKEIELTQSMVEWENPSDVEIPWDEEYRNPAYFISSEEPSSEEPSSEEPSSEEPSSEEPSSEEPSSEEPSSEAPSSEAPSSEEPSSEASSEEPSSEEPSSEEPSVPGEKVNYALGKGYITSGTFINEKADDGKMLTDGIIANIETIGETVAFSGSEKTSIITINLGEVYTDINEIVVAGVIVFGNRDYGTVVIESSADGENYTAVDEYTVVETQTDGTAVNYSYELSSEITAQHIRLSITSFEYVLALSEIQVYGSGKSIEEENVSENNIGEAAVEKTIKYSADFTAADGINAEKIGEEPACYVDENGTVSANCPGVATVYAIVYEGEKAIFDISYKITFTKVKVETKFEKDTIEVVLDDVIEESQTAIINNLIFTKNNVSYPCNAQVEYSKDGDSAMIENSTVKLTGDVGETVIVAKIVDPRYESAEAKYTIKTTLKNYGKDNYVLFDGRTQFTGEEPVKNVTYSEGLSFELSFWDVKNNKIFITSDSLLFVEYVLSVSSDDKNGVITIDGNKITVNKAGDVKIIAKLMQKMFFSSLTIAEKELTLKVERGTYNLSFEKGSEIVKGIETINTTFENTIQNNGQDVVAVYSMEKATGKYSDFNVDTGSFKILSAGEFKVKATTAENDKYNQDSATYTLKIGEVDQNIWFEKEEYNLVLGEYFKGQSPTIMFGESGTYSEITSVRYSVKSDSDGIISYVNEVTGEVEFVPGKIGTAEIKATKAGDDYYNTAIETYIVTVDFWKENVSECYLLSGDNNTVNDITWYRGNVSLNKNGDKILLSTNFAEWTDKIDLSLTDGQNQISFYIKESGEYGRFSDEQLITVNYDNTAPESLSITTNENGWKTFWGCLVGNWKDNGAITYTCSGEDKTSGAWKYEYVVIDNSELDGKTNDEIKEYLDGTDAWKEISEPTVEGESLQFGLTFGEEMKHFDLYVRLTDRAGNYIYASTDKSFIHDPISPSVEISINGESRENNGITIYGGNNVSFVINVNDGEISSGLQSISYKIKYGDSDYTDFSCDATEGENNPAIIKEIIVPIEENTTGNVAIELTVVDNAGNTSVAAGEIYVYNASPDIIAEYTSGKEYNGIDYFGSEQAITFTVTCDDNVFDENNYVFDIRTSNDEGDKGYIVERLSNKERRIIFNKSGKYSIDASITDIFGNTAQIAVNEFVIDMDTPKGEIAVNENKWGELLEKLSCGLFYNEDFGATILPDDGEFGVVESVYYYISNSETPLSWKELDSIATDANGWQKYEDENSISVSEENRYCIYAKITDIVGNYNYISTNGIILDKTPGTISFEYAAANENGLYNSDIDVDITIRDTLSGIKSANYVLTCGDKEIKGTLEISPEGTLEYKETIKINAAENNGRVILGVVATDRSGNEFTNEVTFDIDTVEPVIEVEFDGYNKESNNIFNCKKEVTLKITEKNFNDGEILNMLKGHAENELEFVTEIPADADENTAYVLVEKVSSVDDEHIFSLAFDGDHNYLFNVEAFDMAGNVSYGDYYGFTVDINAPTDVELTSEENKWSTLLKKLTFNFFRNEKTAFSVTAKDFSDFKVYYYEDIKAGEGKLLYPRTEEELDSITAWQEVPNGEFEIDKENIFVVYVKVEDAAGNRTYISSSGVIISKEKLGLVISTDDFVAQRENPNDIEKPIYIFNSDAKFDISVFTGKPSSGIESVTYQLFDGDTEITNLSKEDFPEYIYSGNGEFETLESECVLEAVIKSSQYNSSNLKLVVNAVDHAGNKANDWVYVDMDEAAPNIIVSYDNNEPTSVDGIHGNYNKIRTATITYVERSIHFDSDKALEGIRIEAKNALENNVENPYSIGGWEHIADSENIDGDKHIVKIYFKEDANYKMSIEYSDNAKNSAVFNIDNASTPYSFTIDTEAPAGKVFIEGVSPWEKLLEKLTFGIWTPESVDVLASAEDETSDIISVSYFITSEEKPKSEEDLEKIQNWSNVSIDSASNIENLLVKKVDPNEQFVLYLRVKDAVGNVGYYCTDGIIIDNSAPEITITPASVRDIYNSDVPVNIAITDKNAVDGDTYSGIREIMYEITSLGSVTHSESKRFNENYDSISIQKSDLVANYSWDIVINSASNNSNDVVLKVTTFDNAGNSKEELHTFKIDISAPEISLEYNNNQAEISGGESYFKDNRTATIVIKERNFDAERVNVTIRNEYGNVPHVSSWNTVSGSGNGDDTTHTATVSFVNDGRYYLDISCEDLAGNRSEEPNAGNSTAPWSFVLDKTLPQISVTYDNNNFKNTNYYSEQRVATIRVEERNFNTRGAKVTVIVEGSTVEAPTETTWTSNGNIHTATITYFENAEYTFDFEFEDMAGNVSGLDEEHNFIVDTELPILSVSGVRHETAYSDKEIKFSITVEDENIALEDFVPEISAIVMNNGKLETIKLEGGEKKEIEGGLEYVVENIEKDGVYSIYYEVADKAGNACNSAVIEMSDGKKQTIECQSGEKVLEFSVNRDGSTFAVSDYTAKVIENRYVYEITEDIVIYEINVNEIKAENCEARINSETQKEGYSRNEEDGNGWKKYAHVLNASLFNDAKVLTKGYNVVIYSKDKANTEAYSDNKGVGVSFVVDRSAPTVIVAGLANNGRYRTQAQTVTVYPTDDGGKLASIAVYIVNSNGDVIKTLVEKSGDELDAILESNEGGITFNIDEGLYQNVRIVCKDSTVNGVKGANVYDYTYTNVSVSSSQIMIWWANQTLRYVVFGGLAAIAVFVAFIIYRKKKNKKAQ